MTYSAKVIVATHKKYKMPVDSLYLPLHVGAEGKRDDEGHPLELGYQKDNTGENISILNPSFCELTGLFWAWKNLEDDYIGLVHYRRHFSMRRSNKINRILTFKELEPYLGKVKVFVPTKRRYYIETLYSHYKHTHYAEQLDTTRQIIVEKYPDYLPSFDSITRQKYGYMFNMMIMEKKLFDNYCSWLFDILFELKNRINMPGLSPYQSRFYGRISEIIFNCWILQYIKEGEIKKHEIMEIPYVYVERINWRKKTIAFLKAKFLNKKYDSSF